MPPPQEPTSRCRDDDNQNQQRENSQHTRPPWTFANKLCSFRLRCVKVDYDSLPHLLNRVNPWLRSVRSASLVFLSPAAQSIYRLAPLMLHRVPISLTHPELSRNPVARLQAAIAHQGTRRRGPDVLARVEVLFPSRRRRMT